MQRGPFTRPESRLAARGGSGLTHMCGSTRALASMAVVQYELPDSANIHRMQKWTHFLCQADQASSRSGMDLHLDSWRLIGYRFVAPPGAYRSINAIGP